MSFIKRIFGRNRSRIEGPHSPLSKEEALQHIRALLLRWSQSPYSSPNRPKPDDFPQELWEDLDGAGLTYLSHWPDDWPQEIREQVANLGLPVDGRIDADAFLRYPRDYWQQLEEQDPHDRINYLPPRFLTGNGLLNEEQRIQAVKDMMASAAE